MIVLLFSPLPSLVHCKLLVVQDPLEYRMHPEPLGSAHAHLPGHSLGLYPDDLREQTRSISIDNVGDILCDMLS